MKTSRKLSKLFLICDRVWSVDYSPFFKIVDAARSTFTRFNSRFTFTVHKNVITFQLYTLEKLFLPINLVSRPNTASRI